ncbi:Transposon Ty3-G Gag-Pol polyprotein [Stylophora pistillata]|uniref:Transposon Ty3-G Gag-Pol polyprotein n=1 Tax=Stylophora pistillata TaxID=50429 RepID=A0A2B4RCD9_STYPI|nr:Transposon Ty3-G Gag-Pol polyprotein [Stylophora pistillata]
MCQNNQKNNQRKQNGVKEKADGPTPWPVSPVVFAPKQKQPGKIRMSVEMRQTNQAVQRVRHITPTIKEVLNDLDGATIFSKLDLNQGYNQLQLAPESRYINTFSTHVELRRFARLNFGIPCTIEIFQNAICEILNDLRGAVNLGDDILVYGRTTEEHDQALRNTFQPLREKGLTLQIGKCVYSKDSLEFFGYIFSVSADPKKVDAVLDLQPQTNTTEVRSLIGMVNYYSQFIKGYATITELLRELSQKDTPWLWIRRHNQALNQLKEALTNAPITMYFNPDKDAKIVINASPVGLGTIFAQTDPASGEQKVVTYSRRVSTDVGESVVETSVTTTDNSPSQDYTHPDDQTTPSHTSPEVLARMEITNVCPTRKTNRGRPPTITASGSEEQKEKRFKSWNPPVTQPDERAKRIMLKEALRVVLTVIMKNHVFTFDNEIRKQIRGGPIGLKLTGVLAQIFMIWWDEKFATRLNELAIVMKMNKRYVDDINMAVQATPVGMRYKDGKTHMDERSVAEDQGISDDERTMTLIKQIGNDIHPSIQLEIDYPSKHQDGKLPILDLKVWMETKGEETDRQDEKASASVIMYEFYSKSMASKTVIHARSAVSWSTKRTVLTQEVLRVLLNCSRLLPWERVVENVNEMVLRMQYSGYSKKFRYEVVDSALKAFRARQRAERKGERPLHRPKEWRKVEREKEKSERKSNWYKRGGNESVIFVPATPNSRLRKEYQTEIKQQGFNIKVVEKAGIAIKRLLQKSDPFKPRQCGREDCPVCSTGGKGPCDRESVTYEIKCIQCNSVYVGETARSAYTRGKEHTKSLNNKEERSALWKHCKEKHNREVKQFRMDVTGVYHNDAMLRQITEGVRINNVNEDSLMNSKNEWNFFQIPRAVIDTS